MPAKKAARRVRQRHAHRRRVRQALQAVSFAYTVIEPTSIERPGPKQKKKYKNHYANALNWCQAQGPRKAKPQQRYKNINDINKENYEKAMRD